MRWSHRSLCLCRGTSYGGCVGGKEEDECSRWNQNSRRWSGASGWWRVRWALGVDLKRWGCTAEMKRRVSRTVIWRRSGTERSG